MIMHCLGSGQLVSASEAGSGAHFAQGCHVHNLSKAWGLGDLPGGLRGSGQVTAALGHYPPLTPAQHITALQGGQN